MNKAIKVRNVIIGEGTPKICVPIVGVTKEDILSAAKAIKKVPHDLVEWRVDWFEGPLDFEALSFILLSLRDILAGTPLLFTFRTKAEGGETELDEDSYLMLNLYAISTGLVDLIDVELFMGDKLVKKLIEEAHEHNVRVVLSNHDFEKTPSKEEILSRLQKMEGFKADISKIAVMPENKNDVLTLLSATEEAEESASSPIVTMAMGKLGILSRICGEYFGSAITFGSADKVSAPGQIPATELSEIITKMHEYF